MCSQGMHAATGTCISPIVTDNVATWPPGRFVQTAQINFLSPLSPVCVMQGQQMPQERE